MMDRSFWEAMPPLGLGCMRLPQASDGVIDEAQGQRMVSLAFERGFAYFDTARPYHQGQSEQFLGRALGRYRREEYLLADKLSLWMCPQREQLEPFFLSQLEACRTEYFDCYLFHSVDRQRIQAGSEAGVYNFLAGLKRRGLVRAVGFSYHDTAEFFDDALAACDWDFVQLQLNYADWELMDVKALYRKAAARGLRVFVMEPLRGGLLANPPAAVRQILQKAAPDASPAQWALRWLMGLEQVQLVLSGASSLTQWEENTRLFAAHQPLSHAGQAALAQAVQVLAEAIAVPCTGCGYCSACPKGIEIDSCFEAYNILRAYEAPAEALRRYLRLPEDRRAGRCIRCGKCQEHCPQHIAIPEKLAELSRAFARLEEEHPC